MKQLIIGFLFLSSVTALASDEFYSSEKFNCRITGYMSSISSPKPKILPEQIDLTYKVVYVKGGKKAISIESNIETDLEIEKVKVKTINVAQGYNYIPVQKYQLVLSPISQNQMAEILITMGAKINPELKIKKLKGNDLILHTRSIYRDSYKMNDSTKIFYSYEDDSDGLVYSLKLSCEIKAL